MEVGVLVVVDLSTELTFFVFDATRVKWGTKNTIFLFFRLAQNGIFASLSTASNFQTYAAHRRPLPQAATQNAARAGVHESGDTVCSRKAQCQAPLDNPETTDVDHSKERSCAGDNIERQNVYLVEGAQPPPITTTTAHTPASSITFGRNLYEKVV